MHGGVHLSVYGYVRVCVCVCVMAGQSITLSKRAPWRGVMVRAHLCVWVRACVCLTGGVCGNV